MAVRHRDGRITSLICTIASGAPSADRTTARRSRWSALNWCAVRLKNCRWRARTGSLKVAVRSSLTERRTFVFESGISSTDGRGSSGQRTTPPNVHFAGCRLAGGLGCFVDLTTTASARPSSMRESRPPAWSTWSRELALLMSWRRSRIPTYQGNGSSRPALAAAVRAFCFATAT